MNPQTGKTIGIALLLAAATLAALFAMGILPPPTAAHDCLPVLMNDRHPDFQRTGISCNEPGHQTPHRHISEPLDGGRDRALEFKAYPPATNLEPGDKIKIALPSFNLPDTISGSLITVATSTSATSTNPSHVDVDVPGNTLTLTLPDPFTASASQPLTITIAQDSGILTPEVPKGFDNPAEGYPVTITFDDVGGEPDVTAPDRNIIIIKNPISSTIPSAAVRVELATRAQAPIGSTDEITIDFSGPSPDSDFTIPTSIVKSRIQIRPDGIRAFNPSEVLVQGSRVILTIPEEPNRQIPTGDYTIIFSQSARIKNPFSSGNRIITVSSFVPGDQTDEITAVIRRTTTVNPLEGPRGSRLTLEGKGYAKGTVTVFDGNDTNIDAGEILASVKTVRGAFRATLNAGGQPGNPTYTIRTKDSYGVDDSVNFNIKSAMSFDPPSVGIGAALTITIADWENPNQAVAAVRIAGQTAKTPQVTEYANCLEYANLHRPDSNGTVSLNVTVPPGVPPGEQTVSVYALDQLEAVAANGAPINKPACQDSSGEKGSQLNNNAQARIKPEPNPITTETLEIVSRSLTLSPSAASRGQKITITGSGFTRAPSGQPGIRLITIGGQDVTATAAGLEIASGGSIALTVPVPLALPDGPNEVRVEAADNTLGQATLTIPEATITINPPQGRSGAEATVTGSGFVANTPVTLSYGDGGNLSAGDDTIAATVADANGNITLTFTIPLTAQPGTHYKVTAVAQTPNNADAPTIDAEAAHSITPGTLTATPGTVAPGDSFTIRGEGLPPHSRVSALEIDGINITPGPNPSTDRHGAFEAQVTMPQIDLGPHTIRAQVADTVITYIIQVSHPPLSGPPAQVLRQLIRANALTVVWRYNNATQSWAAFDPRPEAAPLNDLTHIATNDILWLHLTHPQQFQGNPLPAGWNFIVLN